MKLTVLKMFGAVAVMGWMAAGASAQGTGTYSVHAMAVAAAQTEPAAKDDLFAGTEVFAKNASDVNEITMDPDTLDLVKGKDGKRAHNMILNVVRSYTFDKPGMYNMADVDAIRAKLNTGDWHCSVHTRDLKTGESTDICNKRRTDGLRETAIITVEPKELTFIHTISRHSDDSSENGGPSIGMVFAGPGGLTSLAALDPEQFVQMQQALANLKSIDLPRMNLDLQLKNLNMEKMSGDMALQMKHSQQALELLQKSQAQKMELDKQKAEREKAKEKDKTLQ